MTLLRLTLPARTSLHGLLLQVALKWLHLSLTTLLAPCPMLLPEGDRRWLRDWLPSLRWHAHRLQLKRWFRAKAPCVCFNGK